MKRVFSMAAVAAVALVGGVSQAEAATATAAVDLNSAYVWRGMTSNNSIVLQPSVDVATDNGFSINVWGNMDIDDGYNPEYHSGEFSEIDITLNYAFSLDTIDANVGIIEYTFPDLSGAESTTELYIGLSHELGYGFSIGGTVYYDCDMADGFYISLELGYSYDINNKTNLSLGGLISYATENFANYYAGATDSGFYNYTLSSSLSYQVTDSLAIGANLALSDSMDDDVLTEDAVQTNVYGGVSMSYTF
nr:MltA-interacting MipA family protein [uncultured Desulfobulbus sp.]